MEYKNQESVGALRAFLPVGSAPVQESGVRRIILFFYAQRLAERLPKVFLALVSFPSSSTSLYLPLFALFDLFRQCVFSEESRKFPLSLNVFASKIGHQLSETAATTFKVSMYCTKEITLPFWRVHMDAVGARILLPVAL